MTGTQELTGWLSCHLYYHDDRDRLLRRLVLPLVRQLVAQRRIDSFFFVRYGLGGPHIRLRLRVQEGNEGAVKGALRQSAAAFFARWPSAKTVPAEQIEKDNALLLGTDPNEDDAAAYPNHLLRLFPFRPETDRYGGPELLPHSLNAFAVQSVAVLHWLDREPSRPAGRRLSESMLLLARQALFSAVDESEFASLIGYADEAWGSSLALIAKRGDQAFAAQRKTLVESLRREMERARRAASEGAAEVWGLWDVTAAALRRRLETLSAATRTQIAANHLHMAANRLGLNNPDEVYLGRILQGASRALGDELGALWNVQGEVAANGRPSLVNRDGQSPADLRAAALAELGLP